MTDGILDDSLFTSFHQSFVRREPEVIPLWDFFDACKTDSGLYASPHGRLLRAIGEPEIIDTSTDERLSRVFQNRVIRRYPAFSNFYGLEEVLEKAVLYLTEGAQGLEESRQIFYLMGPVGGGKSSIVNVFKGLMEREPIYVLQVAADAYGARDKRPPHMRSPVFESPLGLFSGPMHRQAFADKLNIPLGRMPTSLSGWATKRLKEFGGDLTKFEVVKLYPSAQEQIAIAVVDPGDENNQDVSTLIGGMDIHEVEQYHQNDADAYSYSGGLNMAGPGLLEFREMFKAPLKTLNPLLFASQEHHYAAGQGIGTLPFDGIVIAHSNESEWQQFSQNKRNEAFLDRVFTVKVPYCLRVSDEVHIYEKLLRESTLRTAPCAPQTLEALAQFCVLTRLKETKNSTLLSKMRVYDGHKIKDVDPKAKTLQEYRSEAGVSEGMDGMSTRFAYKVLSATFNHDPMDLAADPVQLMGILEHELRHTVHDPKLLERCLGTFIKQIILPPYKEFLNDEIRKAYFGAYKEFGQNMFDKYILFAEHWLEDKDYRDPDTGAQWNRDRLDAELESFEKPADIQNKKEFRSESVRFCLQHRLSHHGKNPAWNSYRALSVVIEKKVLEDSDKLLPIISFDRKSMPETQKKHDDFVERMAGQGYTPRQVRRVVDFYITQRQAD